MSPDALSISELEEAGPELREPWDFPYGWDWAQLGHYGRRPSIEDAANELRSSAFPGFR